MKQLAILLFVIATLTWITGMVFIPTVRVNIVPQIVMISFLLYIGSAVVYRFHKEHNRHRFGL